jgi:hypothetical protein
LGTINPFVKRYSDNKNPYNDDYFGEDKKAFSIHVIREQKLLK